MTALVVLPLDTCFCLETNAMGIPGLTAQAHKHIQGQVNKALQGAVFYVDFPNLLHCAVDNAVQNARKRNAFIKVFRRIWSQQIGVLLNLNPEKIFFVEDGFVPESKGPIKIARRTARLKRAHQQEPHCESYLGLEYLASLSSSKFIETVCCGNEAEDEIIRLIVEYSKKKEYENSRFYIFSRDSDLFTFKLPDELAKRVYIVPKRLYKGHRSVPSINLYRVQARGAIDPKYLREPPTETPGISIWNPKPTTPYFVKTYNHVYVYSKHSFFLPALWMPPVHRWRNAYEITFPLVTIYHGLFMEKFFPDRSEDLVVEFPKGFDYVGETIPLVQDKPLHDAAKVLLEKPLWETVVFHFENMSDKDLFQPHEITAVGAYIRALLEEKRIRSAKTKAHNADLLDSYLVALCIMFISIEAVLDGFHSHHLLWKIDPWELSTFLETPTAELAFQLKKLEISNDRQRQPET